MGDDFSFEGGGLPSGMRVAGFRGTEGLSRCYHFDVFVSVTADAELDLAGALGEPAQLSIRVAGEEPDRIRGIVSEAQLLRTVVQAEGVALCLYRIRIAPRLWKLGLTRHSRVFTHVTVTEVIGKILEEEGFAPEHYELRSVGTYAVEAMIAQYKESSLDFLHRWMEREGLYYFFEHQEAGEKLVIVDDKSQHESAALSSGAVKYHPSRGDGSAGVHFHDVLVQHRAAPSKVKLADYDYGKPMLDLGGTGDVSDKSFGEWRVHTQRYGTPAEGARLARLRADEMRVGALDYELRGPVPRLRAGLTFELAHHPRLSLNGGYVAIEVEHFGKSARAGELWGSALGHDHEEVYCAHVKALPGAIQYRPQSKTPWPQIDGFENATIDGPVASEYAQIDEQGRYLVKFRFDEGTLADGKASEYVRMMQPHGGSTEGFHFPLRKGTEVLCAFLGGDVDRPVIIGVVPNALAPSSVVKGNATQNIIQTGSATSITIEDKKNEQYLNIYCPYKPGESANLYLGIDRPVGAQALTSPHAPEVVEQGEYKKGFEKPNFDLRSTGRGQLASGKSLNVVSEEFMQLDSHEDMVLHAKGKWFRHIEDAATEHLASTFTQTIDKDVTETWKMEYTLDITGAVKETLRATLHQEVSKDVTQLYGAHHILGIGGSQTTTVKDATASNHLNGLHVLVDKALSQHQAKANYRLDVDKIATLHASSQFDVRGGQRAKLSAPDTTVYGDQDVTVFGCKTVTIGPNTINVNGAEVVRLTNHAAMMEIKGGNVTLKGCHVTVEGTGDIRQEAAGSFRVSGKKNTEIDGGPMVKVTAGVIKLNSP